MNKCAAGSESVWAHLADPSLHADARLIALCALSRVLVCPRSLSTFSHHVYVYNLSNFVQMLNDSLKCFVTATKELMNEKMRSKRVAIPKLNASDVSDVDADKDVEEDASARKHLRAVIFFLSIFFFFPL